ncbi:hypothetical protein KKE47_02160 [Patescibacteria group bacterium]|nr:hypothetical protein [Patescibacteria group bacterium]
MVLYRDPDPFQQDDFGFNIQRRPGGGGHSTVYDRRAPRRISWDRDQGGDVVPGTLHDTDRRRPSRDRVRRYP